MTRFLAKNCKISAVKHSIEKPILLNFVSVSNLLSKIEDGLNMLLHHFFSCVMCFTETALERLSKTLVAVGLGQIDLLVLVARGVMVQPTSFFLYLCVTLR